MAEKTNYRGSRGTHWTQSNWPDIDWLRTGTSLQLYDQCVKDTLRPFTSFLLESVCFLFVFFFTKSGTKQAHRLVTLSWSSGKLILQLNTPFSSSSSSSAGGGAQTPYAEFLCKQCNRVWIQDKWLCHFPQEECPQSFVQEAVSSFCTSWENKWYFKLLLNFCSSPALNQTPTPDMFKSGWLWLCTLRSPSATKLL